MYGARTSLSTRSYRVLTTTAEITPVDTQSYVERRYVLIVMSLTYTSNIADPRADPAGAAPDGFRHRLPHRRLARAVLRHFRHSDFLARGPLQPAQHPRRVAGALVGDDDAVRPVA